MQTRDPDLFFCGIGGRFLRGAGVRIVVDASELAVVGITEVLSKGLSILKGITLAKQLLKSLKPDLLILIDFPDFNLHIAKKANKLDVPVLYYISPQIWAWREGRIKTIRKRVDQMAVILPFEEAFYRDHGVRVSYVGHPLLDSGGDALSEASPVPDEIVIGILPGSRDKEVTRNLPVMLAAAENIRQRFGHTRFLVSRAPTVEAGLMRRIVAGSGVDVDFEIVTEPVSQIFKCCRLVIAVSGTVTLEAAISETPAVIVYKVSPLSYWLGRALIKIRHIGLVNLIAGKTVVPELIQQDASPEKIAGEVLNMLSDQDRMAEIKSGLREARALLGSGGASQRVAGLAMEMLDK
jgi:lipid-A-disaccharide synthase